MKKNILVLLIYLVSVVGVNAQILESGKALSDAGKSFFVENKGQWPSDVLYLARIVGMDAWITRNGVLCDFYKSQEVPGALKTKEFMPEKFEKKDFTRTGHKIRYKLQGNNSHVQTEGIGKQAGYYNYLLGNDPARHASNVGLYKEALVRNVYDGIDLRYYFDNGNLRYDYVVHPGADPSQIIFVLEGTDKTYLNPKGDLAFTTRFGEVTLAELHTYQRIKSNKVSSRFVKTETGWSIALGEYNRNQTLIIDPLIYSTYLGGSGNEPAVNMAINSFGNAYIAGITVSVDYDTTSGAYQTRLSGSAYDIFVTKLNPLGTALVYSTYLGGDDEDYASSITVDDSDNVYIVGGTNSTNYDTTPGAFQTSFGGGYRDVVVTKLNATGTALVYSTYLAGDWSDLGYAIAVDASGNAYITGCTNSTNFSTTSGAYKTNYNGGVGDVFVTKINPTGTALIYSTLLGGNAYEFPLGIAIDTFGQAYVTGFTESADYDTTLGAFQTSSGGDRDIFVTKLNASGTSLMYSTYLGGTGVDMSYSMAINASGNVFLTGYTNSKDYDTTSGAYQTLNAGGYSDVFVTKLNTTGTALVYSTYLGGSNDDWGNSIAVDDFDNACLTGYTNSKDYDTTSGAYQTFNAGGNGDVFVTKLNATGTALVYSTYLGGSNRDVGGVVAVDGSGNVYVSGSTNSADFDTTSGAYQTNGPSMNDADAFVTRLCLVEKGTISLSSASGTDSQTLCTHTPIADITYATTNATGATFTGLPVGLKGSFADNTITISGSPTTSGRYNYTVTIVGGCQIATAAGVLIVKPDNTISLSSASGTDSQSVCIHTPITEITYVTTDAIGVTVTGLPAGVTSGFTSNEVTVSGTPVESGTFSFTVTTISGGCKTSSIKGSITVKKENAISLSSALKTDSQSICIHTPITDITYVTTDAMGATFTGLPVGVMGSFVSNEVTISGTPDTSGVFPYVVTLTGGCGTITSKGVITVKPNSKVGLSSASGTDSQNVCIHTPIAEITYAITDATDVTDAEVTGLPVGVTGSFAANAVAISGTPLESGTFSYVVVLTGGCVTIPLKGSIVVKPDNTVLLSSAIGTDTQSVKVNSSIDNITYTTTGASGATITGLPAGITSSFATNEVIINGAPTESGTYNYTVILTGGCGTVTAKGIIHVGGVGISHLADNQTLQIFPNPSDIEVSIKGTFTNSVQIEIIDALGRISQADYSSDKDAIKLQVSSLENGIYCIRIIDGGQVFQSKIIVQH